MMRMSWQAARFKTINLTRLTDLRLVFFLTILNMFRNRYLQNTFSFLTCLSYI